MKKTLLCMAILALAGIGFWLWFTWPPRPQHLGGLIEVPPNIRWLEVGLSHRDQHLWHHISEGSEMLPLSFLEALKCPRTGRSFLESLAEYGFLVESPDPLKLPVGWTTVWHAVGSQKVPFVGLNCAACHSGEIRYGQATLRIDGAPNLFSLEQFFVDLRDALTALRNRPLEAFLFVRNVMRRHHDPEKAGEFLEVSPEALHLLDSVNTADGLDAEEAHLSEFVGAAFGKIIDERTAATNLEFSYAGFAGGATDVKRQTAEAPSAHGRCKVGLIILEM